MDALYGRHCLNMMDNILLRVFSTGFFPLLSFAWNGASSLCVCRWPFQATLPAAPTGFQTKSSTASPWRSTRSFWPWRATSSRPPSNCPESWWNPRVLPGKRYYFLLSNVTRKKRGFFNDSAAWLQREWVRFFSGGRNRGCPPTPQPSENVEGELLQ